MIWVRAVVTECVQTVSLFDCKLTCRVLSFALAANTTLHMYARFGFVCCQWPGRGMANRFLGFLDTSSAEIAWSQIQRSLLLSRTGKRPTSVTEVRQFLGFTNYFRRFIDHYSFIARSLEELTGKYARFSWRKQCHDAFAHLKESLTSAPVLRLPDVEREFRLITDASVSAVAGVLLQQDDDKEWPPVAYTSRRLRPEERNYHANERETLAVLHALRVWRIYLFKHFHLQTDNQAVTYLLSKKHVSGREARWVDMLANFDMSITHTPGKDNVADPLSRALDTSPITSPDDLETNATLGSVIGEFCHDEETKEQLFQAHHEDVYFKKIIAKLEEDSRNARKKRYFWSKEKGLFLLEDPVWRLCITKGSVRLKLLRMYHQSASSCHPGRKRTYLRLGSIS